MHVSAYVGGSVYACGSRFFTILALAFSQPLSLPLFNARSENVDAIVLRLHQPPDLRLQELAVPGI